MKRIVNDCWCVQPGADFPGVACSLGNPDLSEDSGWHRQNYMAKLPSSKTDRKK